MVNCDSEIAKLQFLYEYYSQHNNNTGMAAMLNYIYNKLVIIDNDMNFDHYEIFLQLCSRKTLFDGGGVKLYELQQRVNYLEHALLDLQRKTRWLRKIKRFINYIFSLSL